jgi:hypothetical protein
MRYATSFVTLVAVACGPMDSGESPSPTAAGAIRRSEVVTSNGTQVNGTQVNGTQVNGTQVNGSALATTLVAVHLAGAEWHSEPLTNVWLEGAELHGQMGEVLLAGTDLVGLVLNGELGDGRWVKLRIEGAADAGAGVWRYDFLYKPGTDETWEAVCGAGASAVVVSGRWNYEEGVPGGGAFTPDSSVFTIGCPYSAVEKCVRLGYRPWAQLGTVPGVELHTSCVRAIRADFCGDGRSQTTNGRVINIYDGVGIQADTEDWNIEAEWTPNGTRCISAGARNALGITCGSALNLLTCGDRGHFQTGTRQMTEALLALPISL